ncbi:uracil-DNA glycosylase [Nocardioides pacificus]
MSELLPHPLTGDLFASPVPPGTGWPGDPADQATPVAQDADDVRRLVTDDHPHPEIAAVGDQTAALAALDARVSVCRACPRLVTWREEVAHSKRASFRGEPYWGRPIGGWGSPTPRVLIIGLAPAANGGNRTGRIFTGDRSGDWLFASLHRVGLANQSTSVHAGDGLELIDTRMMAAVRCAPPANRPSVEERDTCAPWLHAELALVAPSVRAVVALGGFGWDAALGAYRAIGYGVPRPKPRFGHGVEAVLAAPEGSALPPVTLIGSYHPSQQNTFTGRLTETMLDDVLGRAATMPG